MFHLINALRTPPVEEEHPAYEPCNKFLGYLRNTWMQGPYEDMWCKYQVFEYRTTNAAENYHGKMRKIFGRLHPPLVNLIITMRSLTAQAKARLYRMEMVCCLT
ncbi:hypothetical protein ANCCAN_16354 [Ancylostoma caninum]|uniref:MULE transposase domain-containing protein n=1 Tax=Ancylostoma caninum TaxID=29170 RepID=A0A368G428_ANCCA|nr:hypothetical protein ANCCAN_16354 [Ancylostoma caninum]